ncbi:transmembrane protein, putative [Medicago truncatula]|uniref:Transmembrane protein, putative n=1 Tax=Medicago truncatula TaxID=3880 RepID=G7JZR7_MEDTR|nr:transmembrane protein, putative [Medicago truncatula]
MTRILIQIWRWLMHPKVCRFVGFASAVLGLLCYALSSSFNYLFGDWNLLKIFLYGVFSFIISLVVLFANIWRHSRSLRFKAHSAYCLISCAAFAIMSLSLLRQTQCGFVVDLLYIFLGCLIVQLMKVKLQLFILGAGFSYFVIILRSSFSFVDVVIDNEQPTSFQDENLESSNVIDIVLMQLKEYLSDDSELTMSDLNLLINALPLETIDNLNNAVNLMVNVGSMKHLSSVFSSCRTERLAQRLQRSGFQKLSLEGIQKKTLFIGFLKKIATIE